MMRKLQEGEDYKKGKKPAVPEPQNQAEVNFWNKVKDFFTGAPQDGADCPF